MYFKKGDLDSFRKKYIKSITLPVVLSREVSVELGERLPSAAPPWGVLIPIDADSVPLFAIVSKWCIVILLDSEVETLATNSSRLIWSVKESIYSKTLPQNSEEFIFTKIFSSAEYYKYYFSFSFFPQNFRSSSNPLKLITNSWDDFLF